MASQNNSVLIQSRRDGFGSQVQNFIWSLTVCKFNGLNPYLSNDVTFEHNYNNEIDFNQKLLCYLNLHKYYGLPSNVDTTNIRSINFIECYSFFQRHINDLIHTPFFVEIREKIFENKKNPFDEDFLNVAVHVRRPNSHDSRKSGTDTPDTYYLNVIKMIRDEHKSEEKPLKFHIYSQGDISNFNKYLGDDVVLHLNENIENTFDGFLFCDILVTSESSFSYIAAFLTKGKVYAKKFWHKLVDSWRIMPQ